MNRLLKTWLFSCAWFVVACASAQSDKAKTAESAKEQSSPEAVGAKLVSFTCDGAALHGWLYQPDGKGPFPAIIYNHGSEKTPGWFPPLGKFWTSKGYVFFVPHRRGHGRSPGDYIVDLQQQFREKEKDSTLVQKHTIKLHERANADVVAAVAWLKTQPLVNTNALVVAGISYGGIQTVLASEKELGVKAFIPFAPAAMSWRGNPQLRERLLEAVKHAKAPMFLLQAQNDYNLSPSEVLGKELEGKGKPNRAKLYPPFGNPEEPKDGHGGFAVRGSEVWGTDVLAFLKEVLK